MTDKPDGPAFPDPKSDHGCALCNTHPDKSLRQYAAIKLRVPDSGLPWLDVMIEKSNRDRLAEVVLPKVVSALAFDFEFDRERDARNAYFIADAMLNARSK